MSWITITNINGDVLDLDDRVSLTLESDAKGTVMSPFDISTENLTEDLTRFQTVRAGKRTVEVPLLIKAATPAAMEAEIDTIVSLLNPKHGDLTLTVTREDGGQRYLKCRYLSGLEGDYGEDAYGVNWQRFTLNLQATDPYWYASTPTTKTYVCEPAGRFFPAESDTSGTFFPMHLSASAVVVTETIENDGDGNAWPIWTITGPGSELVMRNEYAGYNQELEKWETIRKTLSLNVDLNEGDVIKIDTRPGRKTIILNNETDLFAKISETSALWPLVEGDNYIQIELNETESDVSSISLDYTKNYLKA